MNSNLRKSLGVGLLVVVFTSCVLNPTSNNEKTIIGYWQWIKTTGGFTGETRTPQSAGYEITLHFAKDSLLFSYKNKKLFNTSRFQILTGVHQNAEDTLIRDNYYVKQIIHFQGSDTLFLSDYCMDCYNSMYVRTQPLQ